MVTDAIEVLTGFGVPRRSVHRELFYVEDQPPAIMVRHTEEPGPDAAVTVILDGAQRARADLPFACKGGVCGTCRALLTEGKVTMRRNFALEDSELAAG